MATLALSRLSSKFDKFEHYPENFINQLKEFDNFKYMLEDYIKIGLKATRVKRNTTEESKGGNGAGDKTNTNAPNSHRNDNNMSIEQQQIFDETLKYLLNILENITSVAQLREVIDCAKLFESIKGFFDKLDQPNKKSLINIMFNLNFKMPEPAQLTFEFLKQLFKVYDSESKMYDQSASGIQRKMISLVVVASAKE